MSIGMFINNVCLATDKTKKHPRGDGTPKPYLSTLGKGEIPAKGGRRRGGGGGGLC